VPRPRSALVILTLAAVALLVGCGDDGPPSDTTESSQAGRSQAEALVDLAGVDPSAVVDAVCANWAVDQPDRPTVNQYVRDLFLPLELVNRADPPDYTQDDIDRAVSDACRDHGDDPDAFLAGVRSGLGLSEAQLDELITGACARYRTQQEKIAAGDWSGSDLDDVIREVAVGAGFTLTGLREAISSLCADR